VIGTENELTALVERTAVVLNLCLEGNRWFIFRSGENVNFELLDYDV
jgi:hypothetical protein